MIVVVGDKDIEHHPTEEFTTAGLDFSAMPVKSTRIVGGLAADDGVTVLPEQVLIPT